VHGSPTTQGQTTFRAIDVACVAFRLLRHRRHPDLNSLSRLNIRPARSPVNASHLTLRLHTHDSGPLWSAKPSTCGTFIHYPLPVLTGAPKLECGIFCRGQSKKNSLHVIMHIVISYFDSAFKGQNVTH
jgi:hypothetical protein